MSAEGRANSPQLFNIDHADLRRGSRARAAELVKSPQFFNVDRGDLRRGSRAQIRNRKSSHFFNVDHADPRSGLVFVECCRPYPAALRREEPIS